MMAGNKLSGEAVTTLYLFGLFQFSASMSGIFLNLYLWRLTHDLSINGLYNIITFLVASVSYAIAGKIAKRKDRLFVLRMGIIWFALFYLSLVFVQERIAEYYYLFACFNGIASGFYYLGSLTLNYDVTTEQKQMNSYTAYYFQLVGTLPLKGHLRMETFVARETALSIGRSVSILILILLAKELHSPFLPWVLLAASLAQLSFFWLLQQPNVKSEGISR